MIISFGRKYIFVHIPKTGGTALTLALEERLMKDDLVIGDTPKAKQRRNKLKAYPKGRYWKHSTLKDIDPIVSADALDDFFLFGLVRNPWDRWASFYHWALKQNFDHIQVQLAQSLPFNDFIQHPIMVSVFKQNAYGSYFNDANGVERPAHFVRLEHLANDLQAVERHLGFSLGEIPKANASDRDQDYHVYYNDAAKQTVAKHCAEDIDRFGYCF